MPTNPFPRMFTVRQHFPKAPPVDIPGAIQQGLANILPKTKPGARIAVAVGSRGITNLRSIVASVIDLLKGHGAKPFIVPAMGSHGGATPQGQTSLLAEYGITQESLQVPIEAAMEVERLGATPDGVDVFCSAAALRSDGIIIVNRVKPHTDWSSDALGSGILKMMVIGLGKRVGAANFHLSATRWGYEEVLRTSARIALGSAPILCGVAIVENQFHETAALEVLRPTEMEGREAELFRESKRLMPKLPFEEIDLLIVDRIGKNISGAGLDPNITGRWVHGYSSMLGSSNQSSPTVRRLFVRDLTPETHGNAIGIGLADLTTSRLVRAMDKQVTYINALTALTPNCAKIPIHFDTDREAMTRALDSLAFGKPSQAKIVRIADTLALEVLEVSEAYSETVRQRKDLQAVTSPAEMAFDESGNLRAWQ